MKTLSSLFIFATLFFGIACNNESALHLKTFNQTNLYYNDSISPQQVDKLGELLSRSQMSGDIQIQKNGFIYELKLPIDSSILASQTAALTIQQLAKQYSDIVFNQGIVVIYGCDTNFNTLRVYPMDTSNNLFPLSAPKP